MMKIEIRGESVFLDGYVNVVNRDSRILPSPRGQFIEQIKPKVFERALQNADDVDLLFNHQRDRKLGSVKDGNLELYEDNVGLRAKCTVTDHEVIEKARNGELRGWSFGFITQSDTWEDGKDGIQRRFVEEIDLLEVSVLDVTPAYIATSIEARGENTFVAEQRFEEILHQSVTTTVTTETIKDVDGEIVNETTRERVTESPDYSLYEKQIEILKLKGGR